MVFNIKHTNKFILCFLTTLVLLVSSFSFATENKNFREVEATGRAVLIDKNIEISRKRALEDALYLAALKGGADVNGFSTINSNTVINEQSIVRPTNKVIDFKIIDEKQDKQFLTIKINAIVGNKKSLQNCRKRPINITVFKGLLEVETAVPSELSRKMSVWSNEVFDIIERLPNVRVVNKTTDTLDKIINSSSNPAFNYDAIINGLPQIQAGDYSVVPELKLIENNENNNFHHYLLRINFKTYKGNEFTVIPSKMYDLPIKYKLKSNFQFIRNVSTLDTDLIDQKAREHMIFAANRFLKELHCSPLEARIKFVDNKLQVNIGKKQGLKYKQIGLVKGLNIQNSMLSNSSVILHTNNVFENNSTVLPLNDAINLKSLDNLIVEFVE